MPVLLVDPVALAPVPDPELAADVEDDPAADDPPAALEDCPTTAAMSTTVPPTEARRVVLARSASAPSTLTWAEST